jgi:hypothetical protein
MDETVLNEYDRPAHDCDSMRMLPINRLQP